MRSQDILRVTNNDIVTAGLRLPVVGWGRSVQCKGATPRCEEAQDTPPLMLPVENTSTEIMKPNVNEMSVRSGMGSHCGGDKIRERFRVYGQQSLDQAPLTYTLLLCHSFCISGVSDVEDDAGRAHRDKNQRCEEFCSDRLTKFT